MVASKKLCSVWLRLNFFGCAGLLYAISLWLKMKSGRLRAIRSITESVTPLYMMGTGLNVPFLTAEEVQVEINLDDYGNAQSYELFRMVRVVGSKSKMRKNTYMTVCCMFVG